MKEIKMFAMVPDDFKNELLNFFIAEENKSLDEEHNKNRPLDILSKDWYVSYKTPASEGSLPIIIVTDDSFYSTCVVSFKDGSVVVAIRQSDWCADDFNLLYTTVAHELSHYLLGHLGDGKPPITNLYFEENTQAYNLGDQEKHTFFGTKAVLEGGYLQKEYEADLMACNFVGFSQISATHITELTKHMSILTQIEKINRLKALSAVAPLFKDDEYVFTIERIIQEQ